MLVTPSQQILTSNHPLAAMQAKHSMPPQQGGSTDSVQPTSSTWQDALLAAGWSLELVERIEECRSLYGPKVVREKFPWAIEVLGDGPAHHRAGELADCLAYILGERWADDPVAVAIDRVSCAKPGAFVVTLAGKLVSLQAAQNLTKLP